jgi:hypothetical protein
VCNGQGKVKCHQKHFRFKRNIKEIQNDVDTLKCKEEVVIHSIHIRICDYCKTNPTDKTFCESIGKKHDCLVSGCISYSTNTGTKVCPKCKGIGRIKINPFNAVLK